MSRRLRTPTTIRALRGNEPVAAVGRVTLATYLAMLFAGAVVEAMRRPA